MSKKLGNSKYIKIQIPYICETTNSSSYLVKGTSKHERYLIQNEVSSILISCKLKKLIIPKDKLIHLYKKKPVVEDSQWLCSRKAFLLCIRDLLKYKKNFNKKLNFSISHTRNGSIAWVVFSNYIEGVGVDIEKNNRVINDKVIKRVSKNYELNIVEDNLNLWMIKESSFKSLIKKKQKSLLQTKVNKKIQNYFEVKTTDTCQRTKIISKPIDIDKNLKGCFSINLRYGKFR